MNTNTMALTEREEQTEREGFGIAECIQALMADHFGMGDKR